MEIMKTINIHKRVNIIDRIEIRTTVFTKMLTNFIFFSRFQMTRMNSSELHFTNKYKNVSILVGGKPLRPHNFNNGVVGGTTTRCGTVGSAYMDTQFGGNMSLVDLS